MAGPGVWRKQDRILDAEIGDGWMSQFRRVKRCLKGTSDVRTDGEEHAQRQEKSYNTWLDFKRKS